MTNRREFKKYLTSVIIEPPDIDVPSSLFLFKDQHFIGYALR